MIKVAVDQNHPLADFWQRRYGWDLVDLSGPYLDFSLHSVIILDFLKKYFHWDSRHWLDSVELQETSKRVDCLVRPDLRVNQWSTRFLARSANAVIFRKFSILYEPRKWVYISSEEDLWPCLVSLFFDRGYQCFRFVYTEKTLAMSHIIKKLETVFIGISVELFPIDKMVIQKPEGSLFVLGPSKEHQDSQFRQTMSYFNFLSSGGAIINLDSEKNGWLHSEALATELSYLTEIDFYRVTEWQVRKKFCQESVSFDGLDPTV
jgi:hypothetical protein